MQNISLEDSRIYYFRIYYSINILLKKEFILEYTILYYFRIYYSKIFRIYYSKINDSKINDFFNQEDNHKELQFTVVCKHCELVLKSLNSYVYKAAQLPFTTVLFPPLFCHKLFVNWSPLCTNNP